MSNQPTYRYIHQLLKQHAHVVQLIYQINSELISFYRLLLFQSKKHPSPFHPDQLYYNAQKDCYYCPMGQEMRNIGQSKRKTKNGYLQTHIATRPPTVKDVEKPF